MSRLMHTPEGFLRYMQMSVRVLFVFVEGKTLDPYFYGGLASVVAQAKSIKYEVVIPEQIVNLGAHGKKAVYKYFDFLSTRNAVYGILQGKPWVAVFFLDKDIDDFLGQQTTHPCVIYTQHYETENYVFLHCELADVVASCASLDIQEVAQLFPDSMTWCRAAAASWKDWVKLCLFARKFSVGCACTYSAKSAVNNPANAVANAQLLQTMQEVLRNASGMDQQTFDAEFHAVSQTVDEIFEAGSQDSVFKGSWYPAILAASIHEHFDGVPFDKNALEAKLTSAAAQSIEAQAEWAESLRASLTAAVSLVAP